MIVHRDDIVRNFEIFTIAQVNRDDMAQVHEKGGSRDPIQLRSRSYAKKVCRLMLLVFLKKLFLKKKKLEL